jgi:hypothetical protein
MNDGPLLPSSICVVCADFYTREIGGAAGPEVVARSVVDGWMDGWMLDDHGKIGEMWEREIAIAT